MKKEMKLHSKTTLNIKANGKEIKSLDMEFKCGVMVKRIRDIG